MRTTRHVRRYRFAGRRWIRRGRAFGRFGRWLGMAALWTLLLPFLAMLGLGVAGLLIDLLTRLF